MHIDEMIPSKYLKASDLKGRGHVVVISHLEQAEFKNRDGKQEKKWVVYFVGKQKGMTLNVTNIKKIGKLHGPENKNWQGKAIEIYPTETNFGGEEVDCIRVRAAETEAQAPVEDAPAQSIARPPSSEFTEANPPLRDEMNDDIPW